MRTLLFSTLFPSSVRPLHGIFVETRLRELLATGQVQTRVIAPVPWFPSTHLRYGEYANLARTPAREVRHGVTVDHPRYPLLPKVGLTLAPLGLALATTGAVRQVLADGFDFDVIDAHFYYPDGVAATLLGLWFGKPVTITARGTDLNLYPNHAAPRRMMAWAAGRSAASIGVCNALMDVLRGWGIEEAKLHVMRNGVDLQRFQPLQQAACRAALRIEGAPLVISAGHLVERKGHHLVIDAVASLQSVLPGIRLLIVGDGEERVALHEQVRQLGLGNAVSFAGAVANDELAQYFSAADLAVLASSREGWANVLLESMACGTPVVATRLWGTPEVVAAPEAGLLVDQRDAPALAAGIASLWSAMPPREAVRRYAQGFSWEATSQAQVALFDRIRADAARGGMAQPRAH